MVKREPQVPFICVDRDKLTGSLQLSIDDESGGYRLAGPKYCGHSVRLLTYVIDEAAVHEIRDYLRKVLVRRKRLIAASRRSKAIL